MVHEQLEGVFRQVFGDETLTIHDEMTAEDVEKWDSLAHINLIVQVEKHFGLKFRNSEIARLECVGDLKQLIDKHLAKKAA